MNKLVMDIGGSSIKYAVMDDKAHVIERGSKQTPLDTLDNLLNVIKEIYQIHEAKVDGIAISAPGTINPTTGLILAPGALTYNYRVNLIDKIHEFTSIPVAIENDGKCAALAESWIGNLKGYRSGIVLVLGTGIGGGISQQPELIKQINSELNEIYNKLPFEVPHAVVEHCMFYNDSNLIGALRNYELNKKL